MPPDLLIDDVVPLGHIESTPDAHRGVVQVTWAYARYVAAAVHLLVLLPVLIVVVGLRTR